MHANTYPLPVSATLHEKNETVIGYVIYSSMFERPCAGCENIA